MRAFLPLHVEPARAALARRRLVQAAHFVRRPGCGFSCGPAFGHDPDAHEVFARSRVFAHLAAEPTGQVRAGPLEVDFDARRVTVSGREPQLTAVEYAIVAALAERPGRLLRHAEIVRVVWGENWIGRLDGPAGRGDCWHIVRTNVSRLRAKLGLAGSVIETVPGRGYRLRADVGGADMRAPRGPRLEGAS